MHFSGLRSFTLYPPEAVESKERLSSIGVVPGSELVDYAQTNFEEAKIKHACILMCAI